MYKNRALLILFMTILILSGCAALLPRATTVTNSPWKTYQEVAAAYDSVVPKKSTINDIKKLGFNIYSSSNLKILSYVDIAVATSTLKRDELGGGIEECLRARNDCNGYVFEPQILNSDRYGNFWMDTFNFKRKTRDSGWKFRASFLVVDSVVVEKFWYGEPLVDLDKEIVNPLGPLQELGNVITPPKIKPF
ncbi:MAG: hypothetical protein PHD54_12240 [Desulfuromonadaceae bacterium]|nr:hypothetical protein [Desulfuromonadaceae bacterium]